MSLFSKMQQPHMRGQQAATDTAPTPQDNAQTDPGLRRTDLRDYSNLQNIFAA